MNISEGLGYAQTLKQERAYNDHGVKRDNTNIAAQCISNDDTQKHNGVYYLIQSQQSHHEEKHSEMMHDMFVIENRYNYGTIAMQ